MPRNDIGSGGSSSDEEAFVYIPHPDAATPIRPGSSIVGVPTENGVVLYYEGNLYGAENLVSYTDRIRHAAGRLFARYPTVAKMFVTAERLKCDYRAVGTVDRSYHVAFFAGEPEHAAMTYAAEYRSARVTQ